MLFIKGNPTNDENSLIHVVKIAYGFVFAEIAPCWLRRRNIYICIYIYLYCFLLFSVVGVIPLASRDIYLAVIGPRSVLLPPACDVRPPQHSSVGSSPSRASHTPASRNCLLLLRLPSLLSCPFPDHTVRRYPARGRRL